MACQALYAQLVAWPRAHLQDTTALCEALGLTSHLNKPMYMLSIGSRHKVWLATALGGALKLRIVDAVMAQAQAQTLKLGR